jgi:ubiquinone/menaquinone biosynthesis C-methylase UbiE
MTVTRCTPVEYQRRYDLIASDHLNHHRRYGTNPWMRHAAELHAWTAALVRSLVPTGASVLDCGCGIGTMLAHLTGDYSATGIDISAAYIRHCRQQGLAAEVGWLEDVPYPDDTFDAALCVDVLEHVLEPQAAAAEIRRVVKPRGTVIARVPHPSVTAVGQGGDSYDFPVHLQSFTPATLADLFDARLAASDSARGEFLVALTLPA